MNLKLGFVIVLCMGVIIGCGKSDSDSLEKSVSEPTGKQFLAMEEPAKTMPVGAARESVKDGDAVALLGHIGGSTEPFVNGLAAFTIVDPKVEYCPPECGCPTPWDYCCAENEVKDNIATIKIVNEKGSPVPESAQQLLGVKELSLVVVQGTAKRDEQGNLSVLAEKVFVKKL